MGGFLFIFTTMRHAKVDAEEILKAEKAKDDRQRSRKNGYSMMSQRDAAYARLRNFNGGDVIMQWHVPKEQREDGLGYSGVPDGMFSLKIGKELVVFDAEEFRKYLRWV